MLGGSFNPAHDGHAQIARAMRRALRLDRVWLLVSPGNPLKPGVGMAPRAARLASAQGVADGRRVLAVDLEAAWGTRFSLDTALRLRRHFPRARFVWLMGADSFAELPRWHRWRDFVRVMPIAVHSRAGADRAALAGAAAHVLRRGRAAAGGLAGRAAPAWAFLVLRRNPRSATGLRAAGLGLNSNASEPGRPQAEKD